MNRRPRAIYYFTCPEHLSKPYKTLAHRLQDTDIRKHDAEVEFTTNALKAGS